MASYPKARVANARARCKSDVLVVRKFRKWSVLTDPTEDQIAEAVKDASSAEWRGPSES